MIPDLIPRARWEEPGWTVAEHTSSGPHPWHLTDSVVIHYTAATSTPENEASVRDLIRRIQRDYIRRGYSIGYNWCVDRQGRVWELRGDDFKCAANGNQTTNNNPAILCLVNGADPANVPMTAGIRDVVAHCEHQAGRTLTVKGHRDVRATACPGDGLYAQVLDGTFRPEEDDMQYLAEPYTGYDSRTSDGPLDAGKVRPVRIGHAEADVRVYAQTTAGRAGWVSVAGTESAVGDTAIINFEPRPGVQKANTGQRVALPDGNLYIKASVPLDEIVVEVFGVK